MNKVAKNNTKKIMVILLIVTLCNFIVPKISFAYEINGGIFLKPIAQFIAKISDLILALFQGVFTGQKDLVLETNLPKETREDNKYYIMYSPGIIFSGKVPALDVNFINPIKESERVYLEIVDFGIYNDYDRLVETAVPKILGLYGKLLYIGNDELDKIIYEMHKFFSEDNYNKHFNNNNYYASDYKFEYKGAKYRLVPKTELEEKSISLRSFEENENGDYIADSEKEVFRVVVEHQNHYHDFLDDLEIMMREQFDEKDPEVEIFAKRLEEILKGEWISTEENRWKLDLEIDNQRFTLERRYIAGSGRFAYAIKYKRHEIVKHVSIAAILQPYISSWYNTLKIFSLVALLVVLVYVAIRMVLSSTSKDKAKYKKMIIDWFIAVCMLFVLQYIISLILAVTSSISDFLSTRIVLGEFGEDILMTEIRYSIGDDPTSFEEVFAKIVMYVVLVVYTILFTIQYIKRTIYMAFLCIIAPLVAFTYPLDKLKDGKAQAFSSWLKEFIYTALVQPVHLIIYVLLVNSAIDTVKEIPVYAIIIIGFLLPAEKFVKKMFGLDKSDAVGNIATAFGGAAIMNSISKLGGNKGIASKGGNTASGNDESSNVRTADSGSGDPYSALREPQTEGNDADGGDGVNPRNSGRTGDTSSGNVGSNPQGNRQLSNRRNIKNITRTGKGVWRVARKYVLNKNTGMAMARGAGRVVGAAALGTIGLAAGIATGDEKNIIAGLTGGIAAGSRVGAGLVDGTESFIQNVTDGIRGLGDTYGEGAYGEEEYARMKFDKEFKKSKEYKELIEKYPGRENDFQEFLNAGITDVKKMSKAIEKKYNIKEAIAYAKLAESKECPEEVLYSDEKFRTFLASRRIVEDLTKQIEKIKKQDEKIKKEKDMMNGWVPKEILDDEEKFRAYLIKERIIEDLTQERNKVDAQTEQIRILRKRIVDFK